MYLCTYKKYTLCNYNTILQIRINLLANNRELALLNYTIRYS